MNLLESIRSATPTPNPEVGVLGMVRQDDPGMDAVGRVFAVILLLFCSCSCYYFSNSI